MPPDPAPLGLPAADQTGFDLPRGIQSTTARGQYARYALTVLPAALPKRVRFRDGSICYEIAREFSETGENGAVPAISGQIPVWVFRARRLESSYWSSAPGLRLRAMYPSMAPSASPASGQCFTITFSFYGRKHLEQMLREGITLPVDSRHACLMDALVRIGCAVRS